MQILFNTNEGLRNQLETLTTECNDCKSLISLYLDAFPGFEKYRAEINKLNVELLKARASSNKAKTELTRTKLEIAYLRRTRISFFGLVEQRKKELQACQSSVEFFFSTNSKASDGGTSHINPFLFLFLKVLKVHWFITFPRTHILKYLFRYYQ